MLLETRHPRRYNAENGVNIIFFTLRDQSRLISAKISNLDGNRWSQKLTSILNPRGSLSVNWKRHHSTHPIGESEVFFFLFLLSFRSTLFSAPFFRKTKPKFYIGHFPLRIRRLKKKHFIWNDARVECIKLKFTHTQGLFLRKNKQLPIILDCRPKVVENEINKKKSFFPVWVPFSSSILFERTTLLIRRTLCHCPSWIADLDQIRSSTRVHLHPKE